MNRIVEGYYTFCVWITRIVFLNLLWGGFTLLGGGILGFFPSTIAMFAVTRKWVLGERDKPIFKVFWKNYRASFLKANLLGWILTIIGYLLITQYTILRTQEALVYLSASFFTILLLIVYFTVLLYFFPIYVHFNLSNIDYLKWPLVVGILHPILTIFLIVGTSAINYIAFSLSPILVLIFGGSITAYLIMWGVSKTFDKFEKKEAHVVSEIVT